MCYASGVRIPVWFALTVAAFVILFGAYRTKLGLPWTPEQEEAAKRQARSADRYEALRAFQQEKRAARAVG